MNLMACPSSINCFFDNNEKYLLDFAFTQLLIIHGDVFISAAIHRTIKIKVVAERHQRSHYSIRSIDSSQRIICCTEFSRGVTAAGGESIRR